MKPSAKLQYKTMKNICLVNGSLRSNKASSLAFLKDINSRLDGTEYHKTILTVRAKVKDNYPEDMLQSMVGADVIIFIFPLHNYGLPGALMKLLEDYHQYAMHRKDKKAAKVYVIVNCGFARPEISQEVIRVMKNFCRRLALNWRFAICIGTGPVVVMTKKIPFFYLKLRKAYAAIVSDIDSNDYSEKENHFIKPIIPEPILIKIKSFYERKGQLIEK